MLHTKSLVRLNGSAFSPHCLLHVVGFLRPGHIYTLYNFSKRGSHAAQLRQWGQERPRHRHHGYAADSPTTRHFRLPALILQFYLQYIIIYEFSETGMISAIFLKEIRYIYKTWSTKPFTIADFNQLWHSAQKYMYIYIYMKLVYTCTRVACLAFWTNKATHILDHAHNRQIDFPAKADLLPDVQERDLMN